MKDLYLDPITHDLVIDNDIGYTDDDIGIEYIIQKIKIELLTFFGEYFLDNEIGFPWFQKVLIKNPNLKEVNDLVKLTILKYADEILEYNSTITGRLLSINATCLYNEESFLFNQDIEI